MIQIEALDHLGIRITDEGPALAFYKLLGFDLDRRAETDAVIIIRNAQAWKST